MKTGFIDWKEESLNLFIFERQGTKYKIIERNSVPVEGDLNEELLASLIKSEIDNIYLSLPVNFLTLREQDFPFSDTNKIRDTITYELEGILLGHIDDYTIDHMIIESVDSGSKVLAVCLEKTKLNEIIDTFSSAGLDPEVITSIDLRLSGGKLDKLFEDNVTDDNIREETAAKELLKHSINLRQGEHAYTGDIERLKTKIRSTAILILILFILISTISLLKFMDAKEENESLKGHVQAIFRQVFPEDKKIIDVERQFNGNLNALKKRKAVLAGLPILDILKDISLKTEKNITLKEFNSDGTNITLKGIAVSFEDVELLKNNLSSSFDNVKVTDSNATADKKIDFTIIMKGKTV